MPDRRLAFVAITVASLASCRGGCARPDASNPLSLLPADTGMILVIDVAKLRDAPLMAELVHQKADAGHLVVDVDGAVANAGSMMVAGADTWLVDLATKSGFHPLLDIDSVVVATAAKESGGGGAILRGRHLEPTRLLAFFRALKPEGGQEIEPTSITRGSRKLWSVRGMEGAVSGIFLDDRTLLIGYGGWAEKMADLADGVGSLRSAMSSGDLVRLFHGVSGHTIGGVAPNPDLLGTLLESYESLKAAAAAHPGGDLGMVKFRRATWTVDVDRRLVAAVNAELASSADAGTLARRVDEQRKELAALDLDAFVHARADGAALRIDVDLDGDRLRTAVTSALPFLLTGFARN